LIEDACGLGDWPLRRRRRGWLWTRFQPFLAHPRLLLMWSAVRSAIAWIVEVGLTAALVTNTEPSTMCRLGTSWLRPQQSTTEPIGWPPMRHVPSRCQPLGRIGLSVST